VGLAKLSHLGEKEMTSKHKTSVGKMYLPRQPSIVTRRIMIWKKTFTRNSKPVRYNNVKMSMLYSSLLIKKKKVLVAGMLKDSLGEQVVFSTIRGKARSRQLLAFFSCFVSLTNRSL
jgi:hypothetical protein